ncbi:MAG TPA: alcohol dehydrogenase catalytic domain-containing protein [Fimbriimonas sp.]
MNIPTNQYAVQLVGPGELRLNPEKPVSLPGPHQILAKTEAVGLCFSDMKLLKQFDQHVRKGSILSGIPAEALGEMPNYVPGSKPTVPGHEVVCRIIEVGEEVRHYRPGERYIVQADYRPFKTAGSNGAFGYNFEGGLQEYILFDERVIGDPNADEGFMIRVEDSRPASQVALVEPWACVENSYVTPERRSIKAGGKILVACDLGRCAKGLAGSFTNGEGPAEVTVYAPKGQAKAIRDEASSGRTALREANNLDELPDEGFDDILYFGSNADTLELLNDKLAKGGVMNVVLGGQSIGRKVSVGVGRIHYGGTRWIGTAGDDAGASYGMIPETGEVRPDDRVLVVGAGGPMGQMHVIRDLAVSGQVVAADIDDARLNALGQKVGPDEKFHAVRTEELEGEFGYIALMAPVPTLVEEAIERAQPGGIVNVFAGIPAPVKHPLDLDTLIHKQVFVFGTSGSEPRDMRLVLQKVVEGSLDTNVSVGAVSGMAGAVDGLAAVENRTMDGKIIVYPQLHAVPLVPLEKLADIYPTVAAKLDHGRWCQEAEEEFLKVAE